MTLAALALAVTLTAQPARPKADTLTPGDVVLLANQTDDAATATLRRALTHTDPLIRRVAGRVAAVNHPDLADAVEQALRVESDEQVSAEFVRDILAMLGANALPIVDGPARRGAAAFALAEWFARMDPQGFVSRLPSWADLPRSEDELAPIVRLAIQCHPDAREAILGAWRRVASPRATTFAEFTTPGSPAESLLLTPPGLAARLLPATLEAAGCRAKQGFTVAGVLFRPDGRPRSVDPSPDLDASCRTALIAIATVSVADPDDTALRTHQLVVPLAKDFLACAERFVEAPVRASLFTEGFRSPRLIKEQKPDYTRRAMDAKLEGVVEYDIVVSTNGCVASARETRSLNPSSGLDFQALVAILQWKFEPARVGDKPVLSTASIELTFTLRR